MFCEKCGEWVFDHEDQCPHCEANTDWRNWERDRELDSTSGQYGSALADKPNPPTKQPESVRPPPKTGQYDSELDDYERWVEFMRNEEKKLDLSFLWIVLVVVLLAIMYLCGWSTGPDDSYRYRL